MNAEIAQKPLYPFFLFDCKLSDKHHLCRVLGDMGMCPQECRSVQSRWQFIHKNCREKRINCLVRMHYDGEFQCISPRQCAAARELGRLMNVYSSIPDSFRFTSNDTTDATEVFEQKAAKMFQQQANYTRRDWNEQFQKLNSISEDAPHVEMLESTTNALKMYDKPSEASLKEMERVVREWRKQRCAENDYWDRYFLQRQQRDMRTSCSRAAVEAEGRRLDMLQYGAAEEGAVPLSSVRLPSTLPDEDNLSEADTASSASYFTSRWLPAGVEF